MSEPCDEVRRVVYGPVPSWRLGRSLGVDMVSQSEKTCSFDCAYCQLGSTRHHTATRREYVPIDRLESELARLPLLELDYVTFSGLAEPTLASNLGEAILAVKQRLDVPVAVLTNSSLLWEPEVRSAVSLADKIVAKLDAPTESLLQAINRPVSGVTLPMIVEGIAALRSEYQGVLALQMMFFATNQDQAAAMARLAGDIGPDEIEVNTPLRPCAVKPLPPAAMSEIEAAFAGMAVVSVYSAERPAVTPLDVAETLHRRPVL